MIPWTWFQIFQLSPTGMPKKNSFRREYGHKKDSELTHDTVGYDFNEQKSDGKEVDLGVPPIVLQACRRPNWSTNGFDSRIANGTIRDVIKRFFCFIIGIVQVCFIIADVDDLKLEEFGYVVANRKEYSAWSEKPLESDFVERLTYSDVIFNCHTQGKHDTTNPANAAKTIP